MRTLAKAIIILCLAAVVGCRSTPEQSLPNDSVKCVTTRSGGLEMSVTLPRRPRLRGPASLRVRVTNHRADRVRYLLPFAGGPFEVRAFDPVGKPLPMTRLGEESFGGWEMGSYHTLVLEPGDTLERAVDLMRAFQIDRPGCYSLSIRRDMNDHLPGEVEPIALRVDHLTFEVTGKQQ
jgi:hypothetical protein